MGREYSVDGSAAWQRLVSTLLWIGFLAGGSVLVLQTRWEPELSTAFLAGVAGGLLIVSVTVGWCLRRVAGPITLATAVTLGRGAALAVLTGVLVAGFQPTTWLPAVLFGVAAGLDTVDGAIARATDSVSELGARLDTEMDSLTVLFGTVAVVAADLVPAVFLLVGLARYLFVAGIWLRQYRGLPVYELPPSQLRRLLGGLAMATIWLALLPIVEPLVAHTVAIVVLLPFLGNFSRDWLAVSGRR